MVSLNIILFITLSNPQIENTKIIQDLRDEIARLREKLATSGRTGGASKDDVQQMEVKPQFFFWSDPFHGNCKPGLKAGPSFSQLQMAHDRGNQRV